MVGVEENYPFRKLRKKWIFGEDDQEGVSFGLLSSEFIQVASYQLLVLWSCSQERGLCICLGVGVQDGSLVFYGAAR